MAKVYGDWEDSGGNGIRLVMEVTWDTPTHATTSLDADIKVWTENRFSFSDGQTITYGGSIGSESSTTFTNNDSGGTEVLRATKDYDYTYSGSSYGSSPSTKTFSASLSGAYNGITPSVSVSSKVPARPYAAPAAPSGATATYQSDASQRVSWSNNATSGEPYDNLQVERETDGSGSWSTLSNPSGSSVSYTDSGTFANHKYRYRVRAENDEGDSGYSTSGYVWTTPANPVATAALTPVTGPPAGQRITWTNKGSGYTEFNTEVIGYKNGVLAGILGTDTNQTLGATRTFDHTTANGVSAYTATDKWKYYVRHKTTTGTPLYSSGSAFTSETAGTVSAPNAPTSLSPNGAGAVLDPTLINRLTWVHSPTDGSAQTQYEVWHRKVGDTTWTTVVSGATPNAFYDLPANSYLDGTATEWQVRTRGTHASFGPFGGPASFTNTVTPLTVESVKVPLVFDLVTGHTEASTNAYELRDYVLRAQSQLFGGGLRGVDPSYNVGWSQRFITISLGRSQSTFQAGYHDINNPYGWLVTNKALTSSVATLTIDNTQSNRMRVGSTIVVSGVGSPFDGAWVVKDVTTNQVQYTCIATDVVSAASSGYVANRIEVHGGTGTVVPGVVYGVTNKALTTNVATLTSSGHGFSIGDTAHVSTSDAVFNGTFTVTGTTATTFSYAKTNANVASAATAGSARTQKIPLTAWWGLYYELPFAWGSGTTPRKNGVVAVTNKALTSNVATLTVVRPHYFAVGDFINVAIGDAAFDGNYVITGLPTTSTLTYARTNANVTSASVSSGYAKPLGTTTFFGGFHLVRFDQSDFVVPTNWVLIALRNGDASTVEWGVGDSVDPGYDSDSPVLKQVILGSSTDVNALAGNKPALRIGAIAGLHVRADGNELQAMSDDVTVGNYYLQQAGGSLRIGPDNAARSLQWNTQETQTSPTPAALSTNQEVGPIPRPDSGKLKVSISAECKVATAGNSARLLFEVNTGVNGGGTQVLGAADANGIVNFDTQFATCSRTLIVTPTASGTNWYVRLLKKSGTNGITATFDSISLVVEPVL